jgi:LPS export ABC transporter protein LptC
MRPPLNAIPPCALILAAFVAGGCEPPLKVPGSEGPMREWMSMKGVGLRQYSRLGREWMLLADEVEYERTSGEALMKRMELRHSWRRPDGNTVDIVLRAPDGRARTDEGRVHLQGGVVFNDSDDNAVVTETVEYDRTQKTLDAPSQVTFTGRGVRFESPSFHADLDNAVYLFTGGVRGRFEPSLMKRTPAGEKR